jgi:uncharacterized protein
VPPDDDFDWDEGNERHIARHDVERREAQEVILNDPLDLGLELVGGEDRYLSLGTINAGRILLVVTTWRGERVRVVTAFEPARRLKQINYRNRGG